MKDEYDFSNAKKNPYASKLKKQVTIRIDESAINYFKNLAEETGISYQNLVNLYLVDCAKNKRKLEISFS
jgi:predicted DNA binding CopG/RHH family protein